MVHSPTFKKLYTVLYFSIFLAKSCSFVEDNSQVWMTEFHPAFVIFSLDMFLELSTFFFSKKNVDSSKNVALFSTNWTCCTLFSTNWTEYSMRPHKSFKEIVKRMLCCTDLWELQELHTLKLNSWNSDFIPMVKHHSLVKFGIK